VTHLKKWCRHDWFQSNRFWYDRTSQIRFISVCQAVVLFTLSSGKPVEENILTEKKVVMHVCLAKPEKIYMHKYNNSISVLYLAVV